MLISFELSMPLNNSWDHKWSGDNQLFCKIKSFRNPKSAPKPDRYYYNFGDGWVAAVDVRQVNATEARKLRKNSKGFCRYDWMIDSIMVYGEILNDAQRKQRAVDSGRAHLTREYRR